MSAPSAMTLPGGRVLPAWWHDLSALAPRRLWFAHLIVHQLEALVVTTRSRPLASLADALLVLLQQCAEPVSLTTLAGQLSADPGLVYAALSDLADRGRAVQEADGWRPVNADAPPPYQERRTFVFADGRPAQFLPLPAGWVVSIAPPQGWRFELSALDACVKQSDEWKQSHGFPPEVRSVLAPSADWRSVAVDQPGQAMLLFVEVSGQPQCALGFGVCIADWSLSSEPVLRLPLEALTVLGMDASVEAWRQAWQAWCQQRSLPAAEVEACKLEQVDHRLVIHAPARLLERLRTARSEALKGETWLLAGAGRVRPIALVELVGEP